MSILFFFSKEIVQKIGLAHYVRSICVSNSSRPNNQLIPYALKKMYKNITA